MSNSKITSSSEGEWYWYVHIVYGLPFALHESIWADQVKRILWITSGPCEKICPSGIKWHSFPPQTQGHSCRPKTWKYSSERDEQIRSQNYWFWFKLPWRIDHLHLHPKQILPCSWSHPGSSLWQKNRYLEFWMHHCWVAYGISSFRRGRWARANVFYYWGSWNAAEGHDVRTFGDIADRMQKDGMYFLTDKMYWNPMRRKLLLLPRLFRPPLNFLMRISLIS